MKVRGFTLLELLVAITVTSLLITLLSYALQSLTVTANRTSGRLEAEREARAALEFLERDLKAGISNASGYGRPRVIDDPETAGSHWLVFLSVPLDHSPKEPGDVCLMSYRVGTSRPEGSMGEIPVLYRLRLDSGRTFDEFFDGDDIDPSPIEGASVDYGNWLASGVIGLKVNAWVGGEMVEIGDPSTPDSSAWEAVEVTLEVLTTAGTMQYGTQPLSDLRKTFGHRFTRRIPLSPTIP
jgi:prepilin-type N-terminal cleavage/methylation domain-containing protein